MAAALSFIPAVTIGLLTHAIYKWQECMNKRMTNASEDSEHSSHFLALPYWSEFLGHLSKSTLGFQLGLSDALTDR